MPKPLSQREREVWLLIYQGKMNKEIAGILGTTESTIKTHAHLLFLKLGARNRVEAAVMFVRTGGVWG